MPAGTQLLGPRTLDYGKGCGAPGVLSRCLSSQVVLLKKRGEWSAPRSQVAFPAPGFLLWSRV